MTEQLQTPSDHSEKSNRTFDQLRADHQHIAGNYEMFDGQHQRITYRDNGKIKFEAVNVWDDDYVREQYIRETDSIIGRFDGTVTELSAGDIRDERIAEGEPRIPDTAIYLDKSARPVAWLVDAFWDQIAEPGAKKPNEEYLNIDRANWFNYLGHTIEDSENRLGREDFELEKVDPDRISAIRAHFSKGELTEENWKDEVWNLPTRLDGQHVAIIDEVMNKGGTLHIAVELLRKAIPEATFDGIYFWHTGRVSIDGIKTDRDSQQMQSAPIWYDKQRLTGRGVGDISQAYHEHEYKQNPNQQTLRNKIAGFALSAPHHDPETYEIVEDRLAKKFQQDIAYLTYDMADGRILHLPDPDRDYESDYLKKLADQGISREEAVTFGRNRDKHNKDAKR